MPEKSCREFAQESDVGSPNLSITKENGKNPMQQKLVIGVHDSKDALSRVAQDSKVRRVEVSPPCFFYVPRYFLSLSSCVPEEEFCLVLLLIWQNTQLNNLHLTPDLVRVERQL